MPKGNPWNLWLNATLTLSLSLTLIQTIGAKFLPIVLCRQFHGTPTGKQCSGNTHVCAFEVIRDSITHWLPAWQQHGVYAMWNMWKWHWA